MKWEDWEDEHNTWYSQDDRSGCEKLIKEYWQHVTKPAAAALMSNLVMSATSMPHTIIPQVETSLRSFMAAMDEEKYEYPHICATVTQGLFGIPHTKDLNHQQMMALMGPDHMTLYLEPPGVYAAVEIKVKDFMGQGGNRERAQRDEETKIQRR